MTRTATHGIRRLAAVATIAIFATIGAVVGPAPTRAADATRLAGCNHAAAPGFVRCFAVAQAGLAPTPVGLTPADLQTAYQVPAGGAGQTVAIVDAFDDPSAEADLAVYRTTFGLPPCSTADGCFRKVNQVGGTKYPRTDWGWAQEISLDLDMVSAICPSCHILLVEARSEAVTDLAAAVDQAAQLGATAISNSYGGNEYSTEALENAHYDHPGIAITASSGDSGYGTEFPAASPYVTAVGGTSLTRSATARGWTETAWSGAGSGCSQYLPKPTWQTDSGCAHRTIADVSAVADPNTGVAVYYPFHKNRYWGRYGGTSVAAPIVAAMFALAGNAASVNTAAYPYAHAGSLYDVISGSNSFGCPGYLCTAGAGYDGPTGLGTPVGVAGL
jgi:subtilase family serine protease